MITLPQVTSRDGTTIHYEKLGQGPPLVLVWGALGALDSPFTKAMRQELAKSFTVYDYDRCARGTSGDRATYAVANEIDDLRAVCEAAGGDPDASAGAASPRSDGPFVWATSSGAALALEAAAAGVPMRMLAAHEPPYMVGEHVETFDKDYERNVTQLVKEGKRGAAVAYFMRTVGMPAPLIWVFPLLPFWKKAEAVAHTLPYDAACMNGFVPPAERLRAIKVPTLVLVGTSTPASLKAAADEVARLVPHARKVVLAKQHHGVKPAALRPVLVEHLR